MVLVKSKSKSITKQKQKQRQTVIVNINTDKTKSKRQPRKSPKKPSSGAGNSDTLTNPLYYPSVIHSIQQSPQYTMQPNPQEVKDAIREAIKNITHAASKDQYLEQLQHTNVETPIQPELQQPPVADLQQPAPIANVNPISILAEPAQRVPTPIETPKENESEIVQYVGKTREQVANDRPYLKPINLKKETFGFKSSDNKPFEGVGNIFNSPFVELEKQTLKDKILQAAEERLRLSKQKEQLVVFGPEPPKPEEPTPVPEPLKPLPGWEDEPEPQPEPQKKQKNPKRTTTQRLSEYDKESILKISKDSGLVLTTAERAQNKQLVIENISNRLNPKTVMWDSYSKLKGKK